MRKLPVRSELPIKTLLKINSKKLAIDNVGGRVLRISTATQLYNNSRGAKWFLPVVEALEVMVGIGQRCMCCSGGEAAQVEHYRPKSTNPELAFTWSNLLWICGVCNLSKGDDFDEGCLPINPVEENVWDYFFIDEFGNFCANWSEESNALNLRAVETIRLYDLDRQSLQETRLARLQELTRLLEDSAVLKKQDQVSDEELQLRVLEFHGNPLQPDVADYFLNGPGCSEPLVEQFFAIAGL